MKLRPAPMNLGGFELSNKDEDGESAFQSITFDKLGSKTLRLNDLYASALWYAFEVTKDKDGKYQIFPSFNAGGDTSRSFFRLIVNGHAELSLHVSRIVMDPKPWQRVIRGNGQRDYRVESLRLSTRSEPVDSDADLPVRASARETLLAVVSDLAGAEAGLKLANMLRAADAIHRLDAGDAEAFQFDIEERAS